jgi:hypothetical protein
MACVFGCLLNGIHFLLAALLIKGAYDNGLTEAHVAGTAQLNLNTHVSTDLG